MACRRERVEIINGKNRPSYILKRAEQLENIFWKFHRQRCQRKFNKGHTQIFQQHCNSRADTTGVTITKSVTVTYPVGDTNNVTNCHHVSDTITDTRGDTGFDNLTASNPNTNPAKYKPSRYK